MRTITAIGAYSAHRGFGQSAEDEAVVQPAPVLDEGIPQLPAERAETPGLSTTGAWMLILGVSAFIMWSTARSFK